MLVIATMAFWAGAIPFVLMRQPILGGDFMQFYVFGALARAGQWSQQYDWNAFHELQIALVPGSAPYFYAPAYPPLVPLLYLPLAWLSFTEAFIAWAIYSTVIYIVLIDSLSRCTVTLPRAHALLGALVFPGFIAVIVVGQTSIWPLVGFVTAFHAMRAGRPFLAGLSFAIVAIKPHFGLALALVLVLTKSWRVVAGAAAGVALLAAGTLVICGRSAAQTYIATARFALANPGLLEPLDTRQTHSVHAILAAALPEFFVTLVWLLLAASISLVTAAVWRRSASLQLRFTALLLATLLISPHVLVYDGVLLAPAMLWLFDDAATSGRTWVGGVAALLAVTLALPIARLSGVPLSVPLMIGLLAFCLHASRKPSDDSPRPPVN
ncbi:MAG TPA: glycosyltransferase family 87 protein [Vicinamibacterales bacterium]|nr:glycosyltransferase family 87 protein [Vicinamibacterales bacterium]